MKLLARHHYLIKSTLQCRGWGGEISFSCSVLDRYTFNLGNMATPLLQGFSKHGPVEAVAGFVELELVFKTC